MARYPRSSFFFFFPFFFLLFLTSARSHQNLKYGVHEDAANQAKLATLARFHSSKSKEETVSFANYVSFFFFPSLSLSFQSLTVAGSD